MANDSKSREPRGWYSRGYLPHFDAGESTTQFVTCRLHDSLPKSVLMKIAEEIELRKPENIAREKFVLTERYMDMGYGECFLKQRSVAQIVKDALLRFDGEMYKLHAWVVMPNHMHILFRPLKGKMLEKIMHSIKSYSATEANKLLHRSGFFWMRESFDRYIRDGDHFMRTRRYIENNPVKAKLCSRPEEWEFSSAWSSGIRAGGED